MDGMHIHTNIKSKLICSNLGNIKSGAWKQVATSGKTYLAPAMLEVLHDGKIRHQQSDPYVRKMFSEEVEVELLLNARFEEARFCKVFREWHEAEDMAGISAKERCLRSMRFRDWLLEGYGFDNFPPVWQYFKGFPRVTFEGSFQMKTAKSRAYAIPSGLKGGCDSDKDSSKYTNDAVSSENSTDIEVSWVPEPISSLTLRDHEFDVRGPGKTKKGVLRKFRERPRGVQSVQTHYKDESQILPSLSLGLTEDMLLNSS